MSLATIFCGALVGLVVGATGVGGGSLMTPLLTLVFGVPAPVAVGTDLLFAATTKSFGAVSYARRGLVPWRVVGRLALGSIPASLLTMEALRIWHPDAAAFSALVRPALGVMLLLTSLAVAFREQAVLLGRRAAEFSFGAGLAAGSGVEIPMPASGTALTVATGAALGVVVTLTSVGAGAIGIVALFALYPALPTRLLVGADIAHAVPLTLVAGLGHVVLGTIDWNVLGALLLGSIPAIHAGAWVARRAPDKLLRAMLAIILVLVGIRMLAS